MPKSDLKQKSYDSDKLEKKNKSLSRNFVMKKPKINFAMTNPDFFKTKPETKFVVTNLDFFRDKAKDKLCCNKPIFCCNKAKYKMLGHTRSDVATPMLKKLEGPENCYFGFFFASPFHPKTINTQFIDF